MLGEGAVRELIIPAQCSRAGHELTPPTTNVRTSTRDPSGWECLRCLRTTLWHAHYPRVEMPADLLDEDRFVVQGSASADNRHAAWTERVLFMAGKQFADYPVIKRPTGRAPKQVAA